MGVTLRYAKVIDRDEFMRRGASVTPGLDSVVHIPAGAEPPVEALPFLVLRSWAEAGGSFEERWYVRDPHGRTVHEPSPREIPVPHSELRDQPIELSDEVLGVPFEYADEGYQLVLEVDGREVARVDFDVVEAEGGIS